MKGRLGRAWWTFAESAGWLTSVLLVTVAHIATHDVSNPLELVAFGVVCFALNLAYAAGLMHGGRMRP